MGEEKTNGGGDYVQGEQKVLENDIISDTPNASDVVIISLPQAKTPAHLQADPAIWNPHYRTDLSHHPDRVWPPQKGSVYCETCFRDDCIRWISIRDNITMLMHLLGGDHAVHDIEKAGAEAKKLPLHANYPSDVIGFVLLYTIAEQRLPTLEVDVQVEVNRILDTLRLDIGASLKTMNKLGQQCKGLLRGGRASGDEQTKDLAEIEQKLGLEIPSDAFLLRISEEIARAKWELKGDSHNSLARKDKDDRGGEFETNNTIFPCAYCSESNAAHSRTVRASTSTNNNKGKPWLKALMWAHKLDEGLAARLKAQDFLDVVSARHSMAVEVPGISFLVDGTGGSTRIVLVEVASVFDVVMSSKQPVYAKAG
ncbi:hypothetical protein QBC43DRAFT_256922 [Cladorrhinum sp. PSN259]|nr:hypothetical protein QBC43DRAFT_256922 [Cladorrhinum sp. PSN259]